jgi:hypothetical protein
MKLLLLQYVFGTCKRSISKKSSNFSRRQTADILSRRCHFRVKHVTWIILCLSECYKCGVLWKTKLDAVASQNIAEILRILAKKQTFSFLLLPSKLELDFNFEKEIKRIQKNLKLQIKWIQTSFTGTTALHFHH